MCNDNTLNNNRISFEMRYTTDGFTQVVRLYTNGTVEVFGFYRLDVVITVIN